MIKLFTFKVPMNSFLFDNDFLLYAVDWEDIFNTSGKYFLYPGPGAIGLGYIRVDFEVIEHVKTTPSMVFERGVFPVLVNRLEAEMIFPPQTGEINIPLGFNHEFDLNGEPTSALHRVRRRFSMKARLMNMHEGTPEGLRDPLYLCLLAQKDAVTDFMTCTSEHQEMFIKDLNTVRCDVNLGGLTKLKFSTKKAIRHVEWGPICYLGNKWGFTFTFNPYSSSNKRFQDVA